MTVYLFGIYIPSNSDHQYQQWSLRAHLHPATATSLRHRCVIAPKSNLLFWCCTVTPSDCDIAEMLQGNRFVNHSVVMSQQHRRCITVTRCKWALIQLSSSLHGTLFTILFYLQTPPQYPQNNNWVFWVKKLNFKFVKFIKLFPKL